jgi:hypothetical protein
VIKAIQDYFSKDKSSISGRCKNYYQAKEDELGRACSANGAENESGGVVKKARGKETTRKVKT